MYRTHDYTCTECGHHDILLYKKSEVLPDSLDCPECGTVDSFLLHALAAPAVLRASYHDGYSRGDSWELSKQANKLQAEAANLHWEDRGDYNKEINKLNKAASRATSKDKK